MKFRGYFLDEELLKDLICNEFTRLGSDLIKTIEQILLKNDVKSLSIDVIVSIFVYLSLGGIRGFIDENHPQISQEQSIQASVMALYNYVNKLNNQIEKD